MAEWSFDMEMPEGWKKFNDMPFNLKNLSDHDFIQLTIDASDLMRQLAESLSHTQAIARQYLQKELKNNPKIVKDNQFQLEYDAMVEANQVLNRFRSFK